MDLCLVQSSPFRDEKAVGQEGSWLAPEGRQRLFFWGRPFQYTGVGNEPVGEQMNSLPGPWTGGGPPVWEILPSPSLHF